MSSRRVRFRPPGVKPWTKIGPLGPFRSRLGLAWVIAPLVVGALLLAAVAFLLFRDAPPGSPFVRAADLASVPDGAATPVSALPGVFVGRTGGQVFAVRAPSGCSVTFCDGRYIDCQGAAYGIDGRALLGGGALVLLPVRLYRDAVYVDPVHPTAGSAASPLPGLPEGQC